MRWNRLQSIADVTIAIAGATAALALKVYWDLVLDWLATGRHSRSYLSVWPLRNRMTAETTI